MKSDLKLPQSPAFDIAEGDHVHDFNNNHIGSVRAFRFSDEDPSTPEIEAASPSITADQQSSLLTSIADAIADTDAIPEEVRQNLLEKGYIRINTGLLQADRFATMDQVSHVVDHVLYLDVVKDELPSF